MPSTLTGLVLFVVLLLPGFAYLVGKERAGTERRASPFRETVAVVAASVSTELVVLFAAWIIWSRRDELDLERLITDPSEYWQEQPALLIGWALGLLLAAAALAYIFTWPSLRRFTFLSKNPGAQRRLQKLTGDYPHHSTVSAWWIIFEHLHRDHYVDVACILDDGSWIEGRVLTFNPLADDTGDRDLLLKQPIKYAFSKEDDEMEHPADAVCISARRIVMMFVYYLPREESQEATPSQASSASAAEQSKTALSS